MGSEQNAPKADPAAAAAGKTVSTSKSAGLTKLATIYKTDPTKEEEGTWMTAAEGVEFRVRSQQSETARTVSKQLLSKYQAALAVGASLSQEQNKQFEIEFCALALVTDFKGLDDMACTEMNVRNLVTELPNLRRQIWSYSDKLDNYRPDPK